MDLEFDCNEEFIETIFYAKIMPKTNKDLCVVCQLDETQDNKYWDRYTYKCCNEKHVIHSRCARKYNNIKQSINCPLCGNIPMIEENQYCSICNNFGHNSFNTYKCTKHKKNKK